MAAWNIGAKNGIWKGGRSIASNGYVLIRVGAEHHLADVRGYAYEHRMVAEQKIGRRLLSGEQVHHINGDKTDNRPENLEVVLNLAHHRVRHRKSDNGRRMPGERNETVKCACGCGELLTKYDPSGRPRKYVSGHNPPLSPTADKILHLLSMSPMHRSELLPHFDSKHSLAVALSKLKRQGRVVNIRRGIWSLVQQEGNNHGE